MKFAKIRVFVQQMSYNAPNACTFLEIVPGVTPPNPFCCCNPDSGPSPRKSWLRAWHTHTRTHARTRSSTHAHARTHASTHTHTHSCTHCLTDRQIEIYRKDQTITYTIIKLTALHSLNPPLSLHPRHCHQFLFALQNSRSETQIHHHRLRCKLTADHRHQSTVWTLFTTSALVNCNSTDDCNIPPSPLPSSVTPPGQFFWPKRLVRGSGACFVYKLMITSAQWGKSRLI